VLDVEVCSR